QDAPGLGVVGRKTQAAERDGESDHEAFRRELRLRAEDCIERRIEALAFSPEGVGLNPKSVGEKSVSSAMIVEGIQHHLNRVIVKHVFPMREPGPNFLRLTIEAN